MWEFLQTHTVGGKARIRDGRGDWRHAGLAYASGLLRARHDVNFNLRCLIHPQHWIVMKVSLLPPAAIQSDLIFQSGGQAEYDPSFDLTFDRVRVDDLSAINRGNHAMHSPRAVLVDRDFRYLRHITIK